MKRATVRWLTSLVRGGFPDAKDALDSEKRLKAEVRRLRAENRALEAESGRRLDGLTEAHWHLTHPVTQNPTAAVTAIARAVAQPDALKPTRKRR